ncbi:hypothetical protein PAAG_01580 [Paracoccidioides lutzii Pb01]|uniref:MARVEL domain-containing protein n=1 Tax=Paracoccidioides lutzii (strain ATCC MYA-826 / Pb01) TaxID=502779 RepID=C1GST5_PARBA|nr:hypothetical protein PAAG_01580 [Paracoccidioides lutzii Pb01]EEH39118.2 hypothetical protein PAAG_01580 [Paracoccidioides lutzii Pb01]
MDKVNTVLRGLLFFIRVIQWTSAVIVMGIVSYFLRRFPRGLHTKYEEVIAVLSVVFFIPGLVSPFFPQVGGVAFPVDIIFSYLWLTSFIFTAQDYNENPCLLFGPPGARCSTKHANEAFTFLAFFACLSAAMLEIYNLWSYHQGRNRPAVHNEKREVPSQSAEGEATV